MAKYIDKEQIERVRLEDSCYIIEHYKGDEIDCIIDAPTADVIERSKINDALEQTYKVREGVLHSNEMYEPNDVLAIIDEISAYFEEI